MSSEDEKESMLTLLSPAKSLDFETPLFTKKRSLPRLVERSEELARLMAAKTPEELSGLMRLSDDLATLNYERFQDWQPDASPPASRAAILAFNGDVYQAMRRDTFDERDFTHAQKHIRILSGLYGVLRPFDLIQPHRLEMGTHLANERGTDLYQYWGSAITDSIRDDLTDRRSRVVVNLASAEYASAVNFADLDAHVVTPVFRDFNQGEYRVVGLFAKRARGMMAAWMVQTRVSSRRALRGFDVAGYRYSASGSTAQHPTYIRQAA